MDYTETAAEESMEAVAMEVWFEAAELRIKRAARM